MKNGFSVFTAIPWGMMRKNGKKNSGGSRREVIFVGKFSEKFSEKFPESFSESF